MSNVKSLVMIGLLALVAPACGDNATSSPDAAGSDDGGQLPDSATGADSGGASPLPNWCQIDVPEFSFFVTSIDSLWTLSGSATGDMSGGLGGDFGGITGADQLCQTIATATGNGHKTWHAFLSATDDGSGNPIHAIDRIGTGPWHDANGRLVASGISGLSDDRPDGEAQSTNDLPDECGIPISLIGDAHDVVTGSDKQGRLANTDSNYTCNDWTSSSDSVGVNEGPNSGVMCGHSFPRSGGGGGGFGGKNWASDHPVRGCGKGANLEQNGSGTGTCIGCSGGYGALYCFAL